MSRYRIFFKETHSFRIIVFVESAFPLGYIAHPHPNDRGCYLVMVPGPKGFEFRGDGFLKLGNGQ